VGKVSLPVVFDPEARTEFDEAYDWYEGQAAGRGDRFAEAIREVIERIGTMPRIHATVRGDTRRAVVRGFPDCVFYREETDQVRVQAVFHTSRDPADWQRRV
jgi:plasmid stabilization system protein ParE